MIFFYAGEAFQITSVLVHSGTCPHNFKFISLVLCFSINDTYSMGVKVYLNSEILASSRDEYTESQISRMLNREFCWGGGIVAHLGSAYTPWGEDHHRFYVIIKQEKNFAYESRGE